MARTKRHAIEFDSLEGKILLSAGLADPATAVHQQKSLQFHLNGQISGIPSGKATPNGFVISAFPLTGRVASMGTVNGAIFLTHRYIARGKLPDLSKASLVLTNQKGSISIALNASGSHHYKFTIMSGSGVYTFAAGKGSLSISENHNSPVYTIRIHSKK